MHITIFFKEKNHYTKLYCVYIKFKNKIIIKFIAFGIATSDNKVNQRLIHSPHVLLAMSHSQHKRVTMGACHCRRRKGKDDDDDEEEEEEEGGGGGGGEQRKVKKNNMKRQGQMSKEYEEEKRKYGCG
jgi:hypothetical protein